MASHPSNPSLPRLPDELWREIILRSDPTEKDLHSFALVSRCFYNASKSNELWRKPFIRRFHEAPTQDIENIRQRIINHTKEYTKKKRMMLWTDLLGIKVRMLIIGYLLLASAYYALLKTPFWKPKGWNSQTIDFDSYQRVSSPGRKAALLGLIAGASLCIDTTRIFLGEMHRTDRTFWDRLFYIASSASVLALWHFVAQMYCHWDVLMHIAGTQTIAVSTAYWLAVFAPCGLASLTLMVAAALRKSKQNPSLLFILLATLPALQLLALALSLLLSSPLLAYTALVHALLLSLLLAIYFSAFHVPLAALVFVFPYALLSLLLTLRVSGHVWISTVWMGLCGAPAWIVVGGLILKEIWSPSPKPNWYEMQY